MERRDGGGDDDETGAERTRDCEEHLAWRTGVGGGGGWGELAVVAATGGGRHSE